VFKVPFLAVQSIMSHGRFSVDYNLYQLPITNYQLHKPITKRSDGAELITRGKK